MGTKIRNNVSHTKQFILFYTKITNFVIYRKLG